MLKAYLPELAFDDRKLMLISIPIVSFLSQFVFFGMELTQFLENFIVEYADSLAYVSVYWFVNRLLLIRLRRRFPAISHVRKRVIIHLLIFTLLYPLVGTATHFFMKLVFSVFQVEEALQPTPFQAISATYFNTFAIILVYECIYLIKKYTEAVMETEQIKRAHLQGQLDNLRNQINPHFLFNSLNTLMNLIPLDSERAMSYLSKLSKFYRYTVSQQEESLVFLTKELENVQIFVSLLKERFRDAIHIELPQTVPTDARILPLCLQLLIENAVKHNIVSNKKPLHVWVSLEEESGYIVVKNNIQKKIQEVSSTGIGLNNIRTRIAFFSEEPLIVTEDPDHFTVSVPLIYEQEKS